MKMALKALSELVDTERSYVMDMVLLVTHYRNPTISNHYLPDDQADAVFMNVEKLMELHSRIVENFGENPTLKVVVVSLSCLLFFISIFIDSLSLSLSLVCVDVI